MIYGRKYTGEFGDVPDSPSPVDVAWAAGLFEGEGCWRIRCKDGKAWSTVATLASTDRDVVEKFAKLLGCGSIRVTQPANPRAKTQYRWECSTRADVQRIATLFLPHLCSRRSERALEILALPPARTDRKVATHCPQGHPYDEENTYWYVKDGFRARQCRTCRATHNTAEAQRRRRLVRRAAMTKV